MNVFVVLREEPYSPRQFVAVYSDTPEGYEIAKRSCLNAADVVNKYYIYKVNTSTQKKTLVFSS